MSDSSELLFTDTLSQVYAKLTQQDVEQFYAGYQSWSIQQRLAALQEQIKTLQQQIVEHTEILQQVRPPAVAFATLARLQANGVDDIDLLDRLLERGETWLDLNMQRLDYCEQLDVIHGNYTEWCEHALEGAYDWVDSMRDSFAETEPRPAISPTMDEATIEATKEQLLRKLTSEEESPFAGILESEPEHLATPILEIAHLAEDVHLPAETDTQAEAVPTDPEQQNEPQPPLDSTLVVTDPSLAIEPAGATELAPLPTEQAQEPAYEEFTPTDSLPVPQEQESEPEHPIEAILVVDQAATADLPLPTEPLTTTDSPPVLDEQTTLGKEVMQESASETMLEPLEPFASALEHPIDLGFVSILETTSPNATTITDSFQNFSQPVPTEEFVSILETTQPQGGGKLTPLLTQTSEPTPTEEAIEAESAHALEHLDANVEAHDVALLVTNVDPETVGEEPGANERRDPETLGAAPGQGERSELRIPVPQTGCPIYRVPRGEEGPAPTLSPTVSEHTEPPTIAGEATHEVQIEHMENTVQPAPTAATPPQRKPGFLQRLLALFRRN